MKIVFLGLLIVALLVPAAFAQGKVEVINDPASLVELPNGQPVGNGSPLPSGLVLIVGFYGGTSSTALFEYSSALLNNPAIPAGQIGPFDVILNANPTGATAIPGIASGAAILLNLRRRK